MKNGEQSANEKKEQKTGSANCAQSIQHTADMVNMFSGICSLYFGREIMMVNLAAERTWQKNAAT